MTTVLGRKKHNNFILLLVTVITVSLFGVGSLFLSDAFPVSADEEILTWPAGPKLTGDGAILMDADTGSILYEKNIYDRFYPASTTKILTTLVALENGDLSDIVTVSYAADNYVSKTSSRMGLVEGEQVTLEQALYGIMLESGNEATYAVGEYVGGSIARFIKMMNWKAQSLGCTRSHFANSHGLHDDDHYTCPYDLALISRAAYGNEDFMKITGTATFAMPATNKNPEKMLTNHHWFLNGTQKYDRCIGGKTGATNQAGYALVTYARKDGKTLISVVMHAPTWNDVYADSRKLLEFGFDNFSVYKMTQTGDSTNTGSSLSTLPSMFASSDDKFDEDRRQLLSTGSEGIIILPSYALPSDTKREVILEPGREIGHGDNIIGHVTYTYGDRVVGSADIIYYLDEDPMTQEKYDRDWPRFLIPPEEAFSDLSERTRIWPEQIKEARKEKPAELRPLMYGALITGIIILIGAAAIIIVRKRRL
ncbi:MAG: D-alanyl-D-alanine carboxypeptidase [Lachnospiraceae bacterium]|nr:D-alanyl-D-alanine carboxypeptidase [Lachnospiraceae bacterium]